MKCEKLVIFQKLWNNSNIFHTLASTVVFSIAFPKSTNAWYVSALVSGMHIICARQFHRKHWVKTWKHITVSS